jgi:DNA mismatch repair ATPase MutS
MTEDDLAKDLTDSQKLILILHRLTALEEQYDARSNSARSLLERIIQESPDTQKLLPKLELIHADLRGEMRALRSEMEALREVNSFGCPAQVETPDQGGEIKRILDAALRLPLVDLESLITQLNVESARRMGLASKRLGFDKLD